MKTIEYVLNETIITVSDRPAVSYGVSCLRCGTEVESVRDLSTDRALVAELIDSCNEFRLDPSQLEDVAEDFIDTTQNV